jgi:hypothetical protein
MTADPPDGHALAAAVARRLESQHGGSVTVAAGPDRVTGGYDTTIYFVTFAGDSLPAEWQRSVVMRVHPSAE